MRKEPAGGAARAALPPPLLACACPGCVLHVRRLETLNRQLATKNDELQAELARLRRREGQRAA